MRNSIIISGFPGIGKSTITNTDQYINPTSNTKVDPEIFSDSDSSFFSWIYDNGVKTNIRNDDFPKNYIRHIKRLQKDDKTKVIFVSSHKVVRDALIQNYLPHYLVYPSKNLKDVYMNAYKKRGNDEAFIKFIGSNWDSFISEIESINNPMIKLIKLNTKHSHITYEDIKELYRNSENCRGCRL